MPASIHMLSRDLKYSSRPPRDMRHHSLSGGANRNGLIVSCVARSSQSSTAEATATISTILAIRRTALPANSAGQVVEVQEQRQRVLVVLIRVLDALGIPAAKFRPTFTHVKGLFLEGPDLLNQDLKIGKPQTGVVTSCRTKSDSCRSRR